MFAVDFYTWLTPVLLVLSVVLVAVVVGLIWRSRDGADGRSGPAPYFLYGLSLVCLLFVLVGTGVGVHSTAEAIGPYAVPIAGQTVSPMYDVSSFGNSTPYSSSYTPAQVATAYGFSNIAFGSTKGGGLATVRSLS